MIEQLKIKRQQYQTLLNNCNSIVNQLNNAKVNIKDANNVDSYYIVNDNGVLGGKFNSINENLKTDIDNLNNIIIPNIVRKIKKLDNQIYDLQLEEQMNN